MELLIQHKAELLKCEVVNSPEVGHFEVTTYYRDRTETHDVNKTGLLEIIEAARRVEL